MEEEERLWPVWAVAVAASWTVSSVSVISLTVSLAICAASTIRYPSLCWSPAARATGLRLDSRQARQTGRTDHRLLLK